MKRKSNELNSKEWNSPGTYPVFVEEYNASLSKDPEMLRWWNGKCWSVCYFEYWDKERKERARNTRNQFSDDIYWREITKETK